MDFETFQIIVLDCLAENYSLSGSLRRLPGENLNFLLTTREGQRSVVKIVDEDMPPEVVEMEIQAIEHAVSRGLSIELPKTIQNFNGKIETGIKIHTKGEYRLRLIHFIDGKTLDSMTDISTNLQKNIGKSLAKFNLVMQDFDHPAAHRSHRWSLAEAGRHRDKTRLVEEAEKRDLLSWAFGTWQQASEEFYLLPQQFIHGDPNPENILVKGDRVSGLVDFGDSCFNPAICDLAICLCYLMMDRKDPVETASIVSRAYHEVRPLSDAEFSALFPLVCGRLAVTIAVSTSRRLIDPVNPNWFGGEADAWRLLARLRVIGPGTISRRDQSLSFGL